MDSIGRMGKSVTGAIGGWVKDNITGKSGGVQKSDYTPKDLEAREIQENVQNIEDRVDRIDQNISEIADLSELRPPRLSDVSDKDALILATTGGAAIGGAFGVTESLIETALDNPKIEITETQHDIQKPVLDGHSRAERGIRNGDGFLTGTRHTFEPSIRYENVGTYEVKEGSVTHTVDADSPVMGGIKGMISGGIIGGVAGVGLVAARKILKKGEYIPRDKREIEGEGKVIAGAAGLGAAGGAVVSGLGAMIEAGHSDSKDISWKQPIMEEQVIGQIPKDYHESLDDLVTGKLPTRDVSVEGPKMEKGLLGEKPVMEKIEKTVDINPRFGVLSQILGGAVVGAVGGTLIGIVVNTLRKII